MSDFFHRVDKLFEKSDADSKAEPTTAPTVVDVEQEWELLIHPRTPDLPVQHRAIAIAPFLPSTILPFTHAEYQRKNVFWNAFALKAKEAEANHSRMGAALNAFRDAEESPEVAAMEFSVTGSMTDIETLTERQRVPDEDGERVGQQFDDEEQVALDAGDVEALDVANRAAKTSRRHPVRTAARAADQSDLQRSQMIFGMNAALDGLRGMCSRYLAAAAKINMYRAVIASDVERDEISRLQQEANMARDAIQSVSDFISGIVFAATKNPGDAVDKFGTMVATIAGHMNDGEIAAAETSLKRFASTIHSETLRSLALELAGASDDVLQANNRLGQAHATALSNFGPRRDAYQSLGEAVTAAGGGVSKRAGAAIASIPLVENVVSRAQGLGRESRLPLYSANAGKGFELASAHEPETRRQFLSACNDIAGSRRIAETAESRWQQRLEGLLAVKRRATSLTSDEDG